MGRLNRHLWRKPNISRTTKLWIFNALVGSVMICRLNRHLWRKPNISCTSKLRIFNALVGSVMLSGVETWQASAAILKKIDIFHAKSLRSIEGVRWSDFVSNEKLLQLTKQSWFSTQAAEQTLRWFGHLLRMSPHLPAKMIYDFDPIKVGWSDLTTDQRNIGPTACPRS